MAAIPALLSGFFGLLAAVGILLVVLLLLPVLVYFISRKRYPTLVVGGGSSSPQAGVVVTGASSGIGKHAALYLARRGGFLVFAGVRKAADGEALVQALQEEQAKGGEGGGGKGGVLLPLILDVTKPEQVAAAVQTVTQELQQRGTYVYLSLVARSSCLHLSRGSISLNPPTHPPTHPPHPGNLPFLGLVNNAGVTGGADPVEFLPLDWHKYAFEVNFHGPLATTQAFLPLIRQSQGRIVNVSSM